MRPVVRRTALVSISLLCALLLAEGGLRLLAGPHSYVWRPGLDQTFQPDSAHMVGVQGPARFSVGPHGLRAGPLPADSGVTIVALGGSTTECVYLDTGEAWPALVASRLRAANPSAVWIGNGGKSGLSTRHHVVQARAVLDQLPRLDALVLLVGGNDLLGYLGGKTDALDWRTDPRAAVRVHYEAFDVPRRPRIGALHERTEWVRLLRLAKRRLQRWSTSALQQENADDGRSYDAWRSVRARATEIVDTLPSLTPALEAFRSDLRSIAEITGERGVELLLLTQPTLWGPNLSPRLEGLLWMGEIGDARAEGRGRYYAASALAEGMAAFNDVTRRVCEEYRLTCVDLADRLPRSTDVFYDDMHLNESGARRVADLVAPSLAAALDMSSMTGMR